MKSVAINISELADTLFSDDFEDDADDDIVLGIDFSLVFSDMEHHDSAAESVPTTTFHSFTQHVAKNDFKEISPAPFSLQQMQQMQHRVPVVSKRDAFFESHRQSAMTSLQHCLDRRIHIALLNGASADKIGSLLLHDKGAASRSCSLATEKMVYSATRRCKVKKTVKEMYTYPLHIAISKRASTEIIEMLINAAPSVLSIKDGPQNDTPLSVLLKTSPSQVALVDLMLFTVPLCVSFKDRHENTPLHLACSRGASLEVVRHLCTLYPEALSMFNFHSKSPIDLAQQHQINTTAADQISTYLWEQQQSQFE